MGKEPVEAAQSARILFVEDPSVPTPVRALVMAQIPTKLGNAVHPPPSRSRTIVAEVEGLVEGHQEGEVGWQARAHKVEAARIQVAWIAMAPKTRSRQSRQFRQTRWTGCKTLFVTSKTCRPLLPNMRLQFPLPMPLLQQPHPPSRLTRLFFIPVRLHSLLRLPRRCLRDTRKQLQWVRSQFRCNQATAPRINRIWEQ